MSENLLICNACGFQNPPFRFGQPAEQGEDAAMRLLIPIGQSPYAIIDGYLRLFSILRFPAPLAIAFGILANKDMKKNTQRHGKGRAHLGIAMGTLFLVVYPVLIVSLSMLG